MYHYQLFQYLLIEFLVFKYSLCNSYVRFIKKKLPKKKEIAIYFLRILLVVVGLILKNDSYIPLKKINPQPPPIWLHYIPRDHNFNKLESPLPDYVFNNDNSFPGHLVFEKIIKSFFSVYSYVKWAHMDHYLTISDLP